MPNIFRFAAAKKLAKLLKASAFTLVELIVVITILAILGTVGFLSLGNWSSSARDSQRLADVGSVSKSLDDSVIQAGSYPTPDNYFTVAYSGGAVWYQGTFSTGALAKLGGVGINKRPVDPLRSMEYAYSTLAYGKAYQIKADYEGDLSLRAFDHSSILVDTAYAASGNPTIALVRGNYGGLSAKTQTGNVVYVLAVPSIVTNASAAPGTSLEISANALSGTLLFSGKNLVGASSFNPNVVVFSGASLPTSDSAGQITAMMSALKAAYSGSDISSNSSVATFLSTPTAQLGTLGTSVVTAQLGGTVTTTTTTTAARWEQLYLTGGTYNWGVPSGVTSVSVVCVGGGGGGGSYSVAGTSGGASSFGAYLTANGGSGGGSQAGNGGTFTGDGGGIGGMGSYAGSNYGGGGGGAGGYSGAGGSGDGAAPAGGGGGGGATGNGWVGAGGGGGGVGLYGSGASGAAGVGGGFGTPSTGGAGGSGGAAGKWTNWTPAGGGGGYGGGGSPSNGNWGGGGALGYKNNIATTPFTSVTVTVGAGWSNGAGGACRIVWPGTTRQFPNTDVNTTL